MSTKNRSTVASLRTVTTRKRRLICLTAPFRPSKSFLEVAEDSYAVISSGILVHHIVLLLGTRVLSDSWPRDGSPTSNLSICGEEGPASKILGSIVTSGDKNKDVSLPRV
jgi:hypothetical protein